MTIVLGALLWIVVALVLGLIIGKSIHHADKQEGKR